MSDLDLDALDASFYVRVYFDTRDHGGTDHSGEYSGKLQKICKAAYSDGLVGIALRRAREARHRANIEALRSVEATVAL